MIIFIGGILTPIVNHNDGKDGRCASDAVI